MTGNQLNRWGNFDPFKRVLNNLTVTPPSSYVTNMKIGPYDIINKSQNKFTIRDLTIFEGQPCKYGATCKQLNETDHCNNFYHPPMCPYGAPCKMSIDVHLFFFIHQIHCEDGGQCKQAADNDQKHLSEYLHPGFCSRGGFCHDTSDVHSFNFRHLPTCPEGPSCYTLRTAPADEHCRKFRHGKLPCELGKNCANFHDVEHIKNEKHPFRKPCSLTPYACKMFINYVQNNKDTEISTINTQEHESPENHILDYSHICPWGRNCNDTSERHLLETIHVARIVCADKDKCSKLTNEEHMSTYSHPGIRDIRLLCRYSSTQCRDLDKRDHYIKYRHGIFESQLGVTRYFGLNKSINFIQNQKSIIQTINDHFGKKDIRVSANILNWIRSLQPVHRCSREIFESILVHGHVMSRSHLRDAKFTAHTVTQHIDVRKILDTQVPAAQNIANEYIQAINSIRICQGKHPTRIV
ncbi:unnamed protein product [Didymodactylos carnosus]|uniref:C3H1-type domain-containing protein n=1 Tax=Didymodactylos carnosus TaxID=1234261 RepID=A0A814XSJ1_9BILA|nr:unnamed protein product [Didymodactylos carnosus]CAF3983353.1 unnamed protein product [Didymodactylos carnosus]